MHWTPRRAQFRALLAGDACVNPGSVFDPMSARIAEDLGYRIGILAGSVASMAALGAPDLIVLTLTELAEQCLRINRAGSLPLIVDADHGFGNALNVRRTVEELETAGVAALSIEDTDLPQPFGSGGKARLVSIEEGVGKMKAALSGRQDKSLVIAGRTSAVAVTGVADAIERAKAYEAAGVDAMFFAGIKTRQDLEAVAGALKVPVFLGSIGPELSDKDYLSRTGVRIALQGHHPVMAAIRATYETLKALREGTPPKELKGVASPELMKQVTRDADHKRWMKEFLGG